MNAHDTSARKAGIADIATLGFGEASMAFVAGLIEETKGLKIRGFDIKTDAPEATVAGGKHQDFVNSGVQGMANLADLLDGASLVMCLVTADQAHAAAKATARHIRPGCYYFDGNSCAPSTKQASAALVEKAGGRYVDMAIMAPVYPALHKTPLLLSGPHAETGAEMLRAFGMSVDVVDGELGRASSIKMIRSIMIKGIESLMAECTLAGRLAGVDDIVFESLQKTYPGINWPDRTAYNLERMMVHGERRAAEMREVAITVADLGLPADMSTATVHWQQLIGDLGLDAGTDKYETRVDAIAAALAQTNMSDEGTK